jgi:feruloyl esterase
VALDLFRFAAFANPNWDWTTLDWDRDIAAATAKVGPLLHVDAGDLRPFLDRGGKLVFFIGWNDGHNPAELVAYMQAVAKAAGPSGAASLRLFAIPGMGHCFGGAGCDTFDKLDTIDAWVDRGTAPERIVASRVEDGRAVRTRPLCAWPLVARYAGTGSIEEAASFACVDAGPP